MSLKTIPFKTPIKCGGADVSSLALREPTSGEMRGLKLLDVLQMDVTALITLIPRISVPALTPAEVAGLPPVALAKLGAAVVGFFSEEDLTDNQDVLLN